MTVRAEEATPPSQEHLLLSSFWASKEHAFIPWNLSNPDPPPPRLKVGETRALRSEKLPGLSAVCSQDAAEPGLKTQDSLTAAYSDLEPGEDQIMTGLSCCEKEPEII